MKNLFLNHLLEIVIILLLGFLVFRIELTTNQLSSINNTLQSLELKISTIQDQMLDKFEKALETNGVFTSRIIEEIQK